MDFLEQRARQVVEEYKDAGVVRGPVLSSEVLKKIVLRALEEAQQKLVDDLHNHAVDAAAPQQLQDTLKETDEMLADFAKALGLPERLSGDSAEVPGYPHILAAIAELQREQNVLQVELQAVTRAGESVCNWVGGLLTSLHASTPEEAQRRVTQLKVACCKGIRALRQSKFPSDHELTILEMTAALRAVGVSDEASCGSSQVGKDTL